MRFLFHDTEKLYYERVPWYKWIATSFSWFDIYSFHVDKIIYEILSEFLNYNFQKLSALTKTSCRSVRLSYLEFFIKLSWILKIWKKIIFL